MEIQTRDEFEEYMKCEICGQPMEYYDVEFDIEKDSANLKVKCDRHRGTRSFTNQELVNLNRAGFLPDEMYSEIKKKYIVAKREHQATQEVATKRCEHCGKSVVITQGRYVRVGKSKWGHLAGTKFFCNKCAPEIEKRETEAEQTAYMIVCCILITIAVIVIILQFMY